MVTLNFIKIKTSTEDSAGSSNNLALKICQDGMTTRYPPEPIDCCNTGTISGNLDKGSEVQFSRTKLGECDRVKINSNADIDVTFTQVNSNGWRGEMLSVFGVKDGAVWTYGCPITTWLDVNSQEDHGENNPSSFETNCKVTEYKEPDYDY